MSAIFFDLETSQKDFIGQILNFAFVQVDQNWNELSKFTGEIEISNLELPHAGAILANRINVLDHQKSAKLTESKAMKEIGQYLSECVQSKKGSTSLIGYNSARFDVPFLRTSLIRNGINPYISNLENKDLLHLVRFLSATNDNFPRDHADDSNRLSLRLETVTQAFNLLTGKQTHNSLDDVYLTIELAKYLNDKFLADIRKFNAYKAPSHLHKFDCVTVIEPNYDLESDSIANKSTYVFLDENKGGSLWVDSNAFEGQSEWPTRWISKKNGAIVADDDSDPEIKTKILTAIKKKYAKTTLNNFFTRSVCDIEQDIYRLDFDARDELTRAIWHEASVLPKEIKNKDAKVLYIRYLLKENWSEKNSWDIFTKYVEHRYQGKVLMNKGDTKEEFTTHPTYDELCEELELAMKNSKDSDDIELLNALKTFYDESDVKRAIVG